MVEYRDTSGEPKVENAGAIPKIRYIPNAGDFVTINFAEQKHSTPTLKFRFNDNILQQATEIVTSIGGETIKIELEWNDVPILFSAPKSELIYQKSVEKPRNPNSSAAPGSF